VAYFSVDTVIGVFFCGLFVERFLEVPMPTAWWVVLLISTWLIYTLDRLLDALRSGSSVSSKRHYWHYRYQKLLLGLIGMGVGIIAYCVHQLPGQIIYGGVFLVLIALIHMWSMRLSRYWWVKEHGIALIYTVGIWFGPVILRLNGGDPVDWLSVGPVIGLFGAAVYLNLLMYGLIELDSDRKDGQGSFVCLIGECQAASLFNGLAVAALGLGGVMLVVLNSRVEVVMIMGVILSQVLILHRLPKAWIDNDAYRIFAEWSFWIVGCVVWFG
jgi:hypothetical protein